MKRILIVAHPDDEVLFFSSLLKIVNQIIVCFGPSGNVIVDKGREKLKQLYPISNVNWLEIKESDTFLSASWKNPIVTVSGLRVSRNKNKYEDNYKKIINKFKNILIGFDEVYTHNPWGEYGHEEHVSVFKAVHKVAKRKKIKIFVSSYMSDRASTLFQKQKHFLDKDIQSRVIPKDTCAQLKFLYIKTNCWTWNNGYEWPQSEIFIKINNFYKSKIIQNNVLTSNPPVMILTRSFKYDYLRRLAANALPLSLIKFIKRVLKIF